ncbi:MAG: DUF3883 domain-containing protein [Lutibacter sp.]|nr:DUF3883 domain-containing protein [Lutibacter sp.]
MSKEIIDNDNLGSIDEILFVIEKIKHEESIDITDFEKYCFNNKDFFRIPVSGIFDLLVFLNFIELRKNKYYLTNVGQFFKNNFSDIEKSKRDIIQKILETLSKTNQYDDFLISYNIYFDKFLFKYVIKSSSINLKYSGLRNLLIKLGYFINYTKNINLLIINEKYLDLTKPQIQKMRKLVSTSQLKKKQEILERIGQEAERYVYLYEQKRLKNHALYNNIRIISDIDISSGFDLLSFNNNESKEHDRFIEVKSFKGIPSFFWSQNEINVALQLKDNYCLYLVNRSKMHDKDYHPIIINNPFKTVFNNQKEWQRESKNWFFIKTQII